MRSRKRVDYARSWLDKLGISHERIEFVRLWPVSKQTLEEALKAFVLRLESLGAIGVSDKN
jgi:coenzyme F420-reducing hydrogenase delta subunit